MLNNACRMHALAAVALILGTLALVRAVWGLLVLMRFLRRARVRSIPKGPTPPISLLKPVFGAEPGLEENLVATLRQNYPEFEVLILHERPDDPALRAADAAAAQVPDVTVRRLAGREEAQNPKVAVLLRGAREARHDIVVSADSDVRPDPLYLRDIANGLDDADAVSFVPVLFGMRTLGARLMALLINTDGVCSIIASRGQFTTGCTIGVRREALDRIGGYGAVADAIADDYALGEALKQAGCKLALARRAARVYTPGVGPRETAAWVARWSRTVRSAAPWLHAAMLPAALAPGLLLLTCITGPFRGPAIGLLATLTLLRALVAVIVDARFCWDYTLLRSIPLLPLLWIFEPVGWLAGHLGSTVTWRGRRYRLKGGRATLVDA